MPFFGSSSLQFCLQFSKLQAKARTRLILLENFAPLCPDLARTTKGPSEVRTERGEKKVSGTGAGKNKREKREENHKRKMEKINKEGRKK